MSICYKKSLQVLLLVIYKTTIDCQPLVVAVITGHSHCAVDELHETVGAEIDHDDNDESDDLRRPTPSPIAAAPRNKPVMTTTTATTITIIFVVLAEAVPPTTLHHKLAKDSSFSIYCVVI
jgi:hypothetical protein